MIIQLDGGTAENLDTARRDLAALAASWGHELTDGTVAQRKPDASERREEKVIDPVSLSALIISLPSATLAVLDLADRIRKRRRARDLIDHARQLATQHISMYVMAQHASVEITTLDPDQLLDLLADKPPTT